MIVLTAVVLSLMSPLLCQAQFTCEGVGNNIFLFHRIIDSFPRIVAINFSFVGPKGPINHFLFFVVSFCNIILEYM